MVHQCVSEDTWFRTMLGIDVGAPPLPENEIRFEFMNVQFFDVPRSRAWVMTRLRPNRRRPTMTRTILSDSSDINRSWRRRVSCAESGC
jgi:hypothetical protein